MAARPTLPLGRERIVSSVAVDWRTSDLGFTLANSDGAFGVLQSGASQWAARWLKIGKPNLVNVRSEPAIDPASFSGFETLVGSGAFSQDGMSVAFAGGTYHANSLVRVYDTETGRLRFSIGHRTNTDGAFNWLTNGGCAVAFSCDPAGQRPNPSSVSVYLGSPVC